MLVKKKGFGESFGRSLKFNFNFNNIIIFCLVLPNEISTRRGGILYFD
jgi:hypothetical protein